VGLLKYLRDAFGVVIGVLDHSVVVLLLNDEAAEGVLLEIKEAASALDVGKGGRVCLHVKLMQLAAGQAETQVPDQFLVVPLADAEEIHNIKIQVVDYFHVRRRLMEQHLGATGERFDVRDVFR
jgi:hypothetical protein